MSNLELMAQEQTEEQIKDFHEYLSEGWSIKSAAKKIKDSTCLVAVKKYIDNYLKEKGEQI